METTTLKKKEVGLHAWEQVYCMMMMTTEILEKHSLINSKY